MFSSGCRSSFFGFLPKIVDPCFVGFRASRLKVAFESGNFHSDQPEIQDSVKSTGRSFFVFCLRFVSSDYLFPGFQ